LLEALTYLIVKKVSQWIPFNRASGLDCDIPKLQQAIDGAHIAGDGPFSHQAETLLQQWFGGGRSLLTPSCTHALELCALLLDLGPHDEVIVPAYTFTSTATAFALRGARPVFVDVRPDTLNLDFNQVRTSITSKTRAICLVHYAGVAASPEEFASLASENGLTLIEDNAHGLFGSFKGKPLGTFGSLSTLSFHETKNITCGEGGAIHVNDMSLRDRAMVLREKGTNRSRFLMGEVDKYTWVDHGSSWVLSDLLAAFLVGQLERRVEIQDRRSRIWSRYSDDLQVWASTNGVVLPSIPDGVDHPAHLFHLRLPDRRSRDHFISHLSAEGVNAVFHYQALNTSAQGAIFGGKPGQCPVAERASETLVRLPLHLGLSDSDIDRVIAAATSFVVS